MKHLICLLAILSLASPLSARISDIKLEFEGCDTDSAQNGVRAKLLKIDGVQSVRSIKTKNGYVVALSWNQKRPFSGHTLFRTFDETEFPLSSLYVTVDGNLVNGEQALLLKSDPSGTNFVIDYEQEDKIREESQDLTRFHRSQVTAKLLNVREDNFLDVIKCTLY